MIDEDQGGVWLGGVQPRIGIKRLLVNLIIRRRDEIEQNAVPRGCGGQAVDQNIYGEAREHGELEFRERDEIRSQLAPLGERAGENAALAVAQGMGREALSRRSRVALADRE